MALIDQPVTIMRYGGGRLCNIRSAAYVSLAGLAEMVQDEEEFVFYDAKTGEDITRSVRNAIIIGRVGHG